MEVEVNFNILLPLPEMPDSEESKTMTEDQKPNAENKTCQSERESWTCPHMKEVSSNRDMRGETYQCQKAGCNHRYRLDYDEMQ